MAIGEKMKNFFDKGVKVSKNAFDKSIEASKNALNKASSAVQDFGDKSVVRIEKKQFETKREEQFAILGKKVAEKIISANASSIQSDDADIAPIVSEIKKCDEEIAKRDASLKKEESSKENAAE